LVRQYKKKLINSRHNSSTAIENYSATLVHVLRCMQDGWTELPFGTSTH